MTTAPSMGINALQQTNNQRTLTKVYKLARSIINTTYQHTCGLYCGARGSGNDPVMYSGGGGEKTVVLDCGGKLPCMPEGGGGGSDPEVLVGDCA